MGRQRLGTGAGDEEGSRGEDGVVLISVCHLLPTHPTVLPFRLVRPTSA